MAVEKTSTTDTILLIDDEVELVEALSEVLQLEGYATLTANNGLEALALVKQHKNNIDLIFCDINMPKMNGVEFFKHAIGEHGYLPVVMLTGQADFENTSAALQLGAVDYVLKPFEAANIINKMSVWLEIGRRNLARTGDTARMEALLRIRNSTLRKTS